MPNSHWPYLQDMEKIDKLEREIISVSELFKIPGYYRIYQWPQEFQQLHKRKLLNDYLLRVTKEEESLVTFEICPIIDFYGETCIENIEVEKTVQVTSTKFRIVLGLISKEYKEIIKAEKLRLYSENVKNFSDKYIKYDHLLQFSKQVTKEFLEELFETQMPENVAKTFNVDQLATDAIPSFIDFMYRNQDKKIMKTDDENENETSLFEYDLFWDHYPMLRYLTTQAAKLKKGEYPNGDCICGTHIADLNDYFGKQLVEYAQNAMKNA